MDRPKPYSPGPAGGAEVQRDGDRWTLVLTRDLRHSPDKVWLALTDPAHLRAWAPFDADASLGQAGARVTLTTVGAPGLAPTATTITRAEAPRRLEYTWGEHLLRWDLEATAAGTRLVLWASIDQAFIAMGAAGWHLCLEVLDRQWDPEPVGRLVAGDALRSEGWQRLHRDYARLFGLPEPPGAPAP